MARCYACDNCHFVFERAGEIESCPDCGKPSIREATEEEVSEYRRYREEYRRESN
ncbi:hypothetical protein LJC27_07160 [Christensenellaceae bacterium OttesenSCG-928-M15]|nr:hypothetical protein [Christensenellaceae bacterium OttesenSCG-928-M15]